MRHTLALGLLSLGIAAGCGGPDTATAVDLQLAAASQLLVDVGDTAPLRATAFDAAGNEIAGAHLTWSSDDPDVVSITDDGVAEAHVTTGSTHVHAELDGVSSVPMLIWVAEVADGAVLLDDDQIVEAPRVEAEADPILLGAQLHVVVAGIDPPATGTIVLARQDAQVSGRVVSAAEVAAGVELTLEIVSVEDLFVEVDLDLHDTLDDAGIMAFTLGGFTCEDAGTATAWPQPDLVTALTNGLMFDRDFTLVEHSAVVEHALMRVSGVLRVDVSGTLAFPLSWQGSVKCNRNLGELQFPVPGPLAPVLAVKVPLGAGFEATGSFNAVTVVYHALGFVRAAVDLGFEYTAADGFRELSELTPSHGLDVTWDTPALDVGVTVKASLFPYLSAKLKIGSTIGDLSLDLAGLKAGVKGEYELTAPADQVNDPMVASKYQVAMHGELSAGSDYKSFLEMLGIMVSTINLDPPPDAALLRSPKGTATASSQDVVANQPVTLMTSLDPATVDFVDGYNVAAVHVFREQPDSTWSEVASVAPSASEQTDFPWDWTPTAADEEATEPARFAVYVETTEMPGTLLEIEPDSREGVGGRIAIEPPSLLFEETDDTVTIIVNDGTAPQAGVDVTFAVTGAAASPTSGTTDADGKITTTITPPLGTTDTSVSFTVTADDHVATPFSKHVSIPMGVPGLLAIYSNGAEAREGPVFDGWWGSCDMTHYQIYQGVCTDLLDTPVTWVDGTGFDVSWTGYLKAPVAGDYNINSYYWVDGTIQVVVNGTTVADFNTTGGGYGAIVTLPKGWVPITMTFAANGGTNDMQLFWQPPGDPGFTLVPRANLASHP